MLSTRVIVVLLLNFIGSVLLHPIINPTTTTEESIPGVVIYTPDQYSFNVSCCTFF